MFDVFVFINVSRMATECLLYGMVNFISSSTNLPLSPRVLKCGIYVGNTVCIKCFSELICSCTLIWNPLISIPNSVCYSTHTMCMHVRVISNVMIPSCEYKKNVHNKTIQFWLQKMYMSNDRLSDFFSDCQCELHDWDIYWTNIRTHWNHSKIWWKY